MTPADLDALEQAALRALSGLKEVQVSSTLWIGLPMRVPGAIFRDQAQAAIRQVFDAVRQRP